MLKFNILLFSILYLCLIRERLQTLQFAFLLLGLRIFYVLLITEFYYHKIIIYTIKKLSNLTDIATISSKSEKKFSHFLSKVSKNETLAPAIAKIIFLIRNSAKQLFDAHKCTFHCPLIVFTTLV